ncbi:MAG TPA: hypothetical protein VNC63_15635 [Propionibacteriaceae bacterium]|nr:hypothetical protein [Propionibacteriaceae bacterium]
MTDRFELLRSLALAVFDCSLRSLRCSLGCRRLRRIWWNGKALFRHVLLQIGGAKHRGRGSRLKAGYFVGPRRRKKRVGSFLLSTAARDPGFRQPSLIQYMRTG